MDFLLQNLAIFLGLILFVYFSWRKIELGIYAIIFFLPLYLIRAEIFGVPTTLLEVGIYILFTVWLAKKISDLSLRGVNGRSDEAIHSQVLRLLRFARNGISVYCGSLKKEEKTLFLGIFLLMAGAIISTVLSIDIKTSAGIFKGWFFDPFLFFIILISEIKTSKQKENVLKAFFISGLAVAAISLIYWFAPSLGGVSYDGRLHAFYLSPNYLAMYLAPALLIGVWIFFLQRNLSLRDFDILPPTRLILPSRMRERENGGEGYFWLAGLLIIALVIYFTFSYAAWIAVFATITIILFFYLSAGKMPSFHWKLGIQADRKTSFPKKLFFFGAIFFVFAVAGLSQLGTAKLDDFKNLSYRSSFNSRLMIWRAAWEIGKDNPFFGIGPGNFQKYYLDYQSRVLGAEPYLEWAVPQPHNIFLAFWLETGILGLAGFILLLFWFFMAVLDNFRKNKPLSALLFSLMAYTLIHGFVDTTYWKNDLSIIFWIIIGLSVILFNPVRDSSLSGAGKNVFPKSSTSY